MKVLELFSGYGTASFALKRLGVDYELIGYSDIDKYANQCFKQNHCPEDTEDKLRLEDCKLIDPIKLGDFDLLTGGFPCQAFSTAGKGQGINDEKGRGLLFNEIIRIAEVKKPRYMLLENVKGLLSKKHKEFYNYTIQELTRIGYSVFQIYDKKNKGNRVPILNTKDYGVPQNRERVWYICFREKEDFMKFKLPEKEELKIFIKDILESEPVDQKYYLKPNQVKKLLDAIKKKMEKGISKTIRSGGKQSLTPKHEWDVVSVQWDLNKEGLSSQQNRAYSVDSVSPTLQTGTEPKIFDIPKNSLQMIQIPRGSNPGYVKEQEVCPTISSSQFQHNNFIEDKPIVIDPYNTSLPEHQEVSTTLRTNWSNGNSQVMVVNTQPRSENRQSLVNGTSKGGSGVIWKEDGTTYCVDTSNTQAVSLSMNKIGIFRRLTPKECFRLQGFLDDEINLEGLSDTQRYKLAGNGQSVNVVTKIFERMFNEKI
jgi:DNA-cytosine methyltransferase